MKNLAAAVALAVLCLSAIGCGNSCSNSNSAKPAQAQASPARIASTVIVDLSKPLPATLVVYQGQTVEFVKGSAKVTAKVTVKETDSKGVLFDARPSNTFDQAARYRSTRLGEGEFNVEFPSQGQLTVIKTFKIKVTVKPIPKNV